MSLWWVRKDELDPDQVGLIEGLPLQESFLVTGPAGCGKTNVLLRRAQFVRGQSMPNVLVLTFTRPLTEFVKTGCFDDQGREIFPLNCVNTMDSWLRSLYAAHGRRLPNRPERFVDWRRELAAGAQRLTPSDRIPIYDALFVDEAQDLLQEEVDTIAAWSHTRFFVGDDRQQIYSESAGLDAVGIGIPSGNRKALTFHYRLAPEICRMADRILIPDGGQSLVSTCHYKGPTPASINVQPKAQSEEIQLRSAAERLTQQVRVYEDMLREGDRIGVVVARRDDRQVVFDFLSQDPTLGNLVQIVRAREANESDHDPSFAPDRPICILTVKGCKGLEFRTVHWLFCDELSHHHGPEEYYTVVTRAKTGLDLYYTRSLPDVLARAYAPEGVTPW